jgi:hypothetical protein
MVNVVIFAITICRFPFLMHVFRDEGLVDHARNMSSPANNLLQWKIELFSAPNLTKQGRKKWQDQTVNLFQGE